MNEIRPTERSEPNPPRFDDEIDLIDLVITLWRRKWVVLGVFLLVVLGAAIFAYSQGPERQKDVRISSFYEIPAVTFPGGDHQEIRNIYDPQSLSELVSRVYIPDLEREGINVKIDVENPKSTNLLVFSTKLPANDESQVDKGVMAHEALLGRIEKSVKNRIDSLSNGPNSGSVTVLGGGVVGSAQVDEVAVDSGPGKALIVTLGAILGLFAGLFAALMVGFFSAARKRLHESKSTED